MSGAALVVIGRGSYLAREFAARHADLPMRLIGHEEVDVQDCYAAAAGVVNFAFAPALHAAPYDASLDVDLRAARRAAEYGMHYVMISSRRVYDADAQRNAGEHSPAEGIDAYGRNKRQIERALQALCGERLTILRPGNVVGYEPIPGRDRFAAYLQNQLRTTGRIHLTVSPQVRRDLVPVEFFCRVLRAALLRRVPGIFNVGAGRATSVGDAARWLIAGFGSGQIIAESDRRTDEFLLDSSKLARVFGLGCGEHDVEHALREAGRRLAALEAGSVGAR